MCRFWGGDFIEVHRRSICQRRVGVGHYVRSPFASQIAEDQPIAAAMAKHTPFMSMYIHMMRIAQDMCLSFRPIFAAVAPSNTTT